MTLLSPLPLTAEQVYRHLGARDLLTKAQEADLAARRDAGDRTAIDVLVAHNQRLVSSVVARYQFGSSLDMDDHLQNGNIGLLRAAEKFDPARGRFTTVATWWIRQAVTRGIHDQERPVRIPVHAAEAMARLYKAEDRINGSGERASEEAVALELGWSVAQVRQYRYWRRDPISLSRPLGENGDTLADVIPDTGDTAADAETMVVAQQRKAVCAALLARLTPRQRQAVGWYFGFDGIEGRTLDDVGKLMGLTRERVRQIVKMAIGILQRSAPPEIAELVSEL
jgi:RNA polymerase primary sigma factor